MNYKSLILIFLIFSVSVSVAENQIDDIKKSFKVSGGGTLDVSINNGDILVKEWNKNEVSVTVEGFNQGDKDDVQIVQEGNNVRVKMLRGWSSVDIEINIPKRYNLKLKTLSGDIIFEGNLTGNVDVNTNGGDIKVGNIDGNIDVRTLGGDIKIGNVSKDAKVNTMGGEISTGNIGGEASIQTMGGDISVKDVKMNLFIKTFGGDISLGKISDNANVSTHGGDVVVEEFNGVIDVSSQGGDLIINKGNGTIKASTAAGDIKFSSITGEVNAKTFSGEVYLEFSPKLNSNSRITTSNGDIHLSIPGNAKTKINAIVKTPRPPKPPSPSSPFDSEETNIKSDFTAELDSQKSRHQQQKTYILNGGGSQISLETFSSEIIIEKAKK